MTTAAGSDEFAELLRAATAVVSSDEARPTTLGTAFRVSPEYAVTAAHVVDAVGRQVRLTFGDSSSCTARVVAASPKPSESRHWSFADHAVLRLQPSQALTAPCALLAEPQLLPDDPLLICALNANYLDNSTSPVLEVYRHYDVRDVHAVDTKHPFFTINGDRAVIKGMSGGPVWSLRHGGVVGFVKASEGLEPSAGGAIAYLLGGLRALSEPILYEDLVVSHDGYHYRERAWVDRLMGTEATLRRWLVQIHGLLAGLPEGRPRRAPRGFLDELLQRQLRLSPRGRSFVLFRDIAEYLGTDSRNREEDLVEFCRQAARRVGDRILAEKFLRLIDNIDWNRPQRGRIAEQTTAATQGTTLFGVVLPEESPMVDPHTPRPYRYEVHKRLGESEIVPHEQSRPFPNYDRAVQELKSALDLYLSDTGGPRDAVQMVIALPDNQLATERLYEWRRHDERPFGRFPMRLRRSTTWEKTKEQIGELAERHRRLRQADHPGLAWLNCSDPRAGSLPQLHELFDTSIAADPRDAVAVTEPPTEQVLAAAAGNSLPVTMWRNEQCGRHEQGTNRCAGAAFRTLIEQRLSTVAVVDWHSVIWREQRGAPPDDRKFWRKIIFIDDRPGESRLRPPPLAGPGPRGSL